MSFFVFGSTNREIKLQFLQLYNRPDRRIDLVLNCSISGKRKLKMHVVGNTSLVSPDRRGYRRFPRAGRLLYRMNQISIIRNQPF